MECTPMRSSCKYFHCKYCGHIQSELVEIEYIPQFVDFGILVIKEHITVYFPCVLCGKETEYVIYPTNKEYEFIFSKINK